MTDRQEQLLNTLAPHLPLWSRENVKTSRFMRYAQAYLMMADDAKYRPAAPSDGFGGIYLSEEELSEEPRLCEEACQYALRFYKEDESHSFHVGVTNYSTNRVVAFCIEAVRNLNAGSPGEPTALRLLKLALDELLRARARREAA